MKTTILLLLATAACCSDVMPEYNAKTMEAAVVAISTGNKEKVKEFDEQLTALMAIAKREQYDQSTSEAVISGASSLRLVANQKLNAERLKRLYACILSVASPKERYGTFTTIVSDESKAENMLRVADEGYYGHYIVSVYVPVVATLLRPVDGKPAPGDLPDLTVYRDEGESDLAYKRRVDANAQKANAIGDAPRVALYQPIILEFFKTWLAQANLDKTKSAQVQLAFERVAGKGTWAKLVAPAEPKHTP